MSGEGSSLKMLLEYIGQNYMTLLLITGLIVVLISNKRVKIEGMKYMWAIIIIVFVLSICEYTEYLCDKYHKPVWILYVKSAITYNLYPLLLILELYLVAPVKHKKLLLLPYLVTVALVISDLFGTRFVYSYGADHSFKGGTISFVPALILCFYIIQLMHYSLYLIVQHEYTKGMIVIFMSFTSLITILLEYWDIITKHTTEVAALEILIYYFYLAAIQHSRVQQELHESQLELERQTNELLMAQIQPHFINNSLMAIQARCIDYPEVYDSIRNFSIYLRSNFDNIGNTHHITFEQELKNIKAYLTLEKMNFGDRLTVEYDIESDDFFLPALTIEPLVENAVRHGIAARENGGVLQIIQRDDEDGITIDVRDIGSGRLNLTERQEKRKGIGMANVRARLAAGGKGRLELIQEENGCLARVTLNNVVYATDEEEGTR